jgi:ribosomal protein S18 acetylase RimI-like enzyme
LRELLRAAEVRGFSRVILETTETWTEVISFYEENGFRPFERRGGDLYLARQLGNRSIERE